MEWNVRPCVLPLCTAVIGVMVTSGSANALIINDDTSSPDGVGATTETENFSVFASDTDSTLATDTLVFDLFDGTLDSVTVTITSSRDTTLSVDGPEGGDANSSHSGEVTSTALGATNESIFFGTLTASCEFGTCPGEDNSLGVAVSDNLFSLLGLGAPTLSNFEGSGTFEIELTALASLTSCIPGSTEPVSCEATTAWSGDIEVAYGFTPSVEVPEPATLGLFGLGLAGLGVLARRRRKSTAA